MTAPLSVGAKFRWIAAALAMLLLLTSTGFGVWGPADARLAEARFTLQNRVPTGDIVFVDIDARSLLEVGQWPWPRSIHARLLDRLMDLGAYEVAFDIDFSTRSSPAEDQALADSLERAGGYAYLAAFRQLDAGGREVWNIPIPDFAAHADLALVNVDSIEGGLLWALPARARDRDIPSIAARFSPGSPLPAEIRIDYSIDLTRIPRISAVDLLSGNVDTDLIRDRQVVIGASALELHDLFLVPRYGIIPGPVVQIAAAETLKLGRSLQWPGFWPTLLVGALLLAISALLPRIALVRISASIAAISIGAEIAAFALLEAYGLTLSIMPIHLAGVAVLVIRLLEERAIRRRQLTQHRARLAYLANHDVRTGAMSHAAWLDEVDHRLETQLVWIFLLRIRRLDQVAAALGFQTVEAAVSQLFERLHALSPSPIGRMESDIFAVALDQPLVPSQIETILSRLEQPYEVDGHRIIVELRWGASDAETAATGLNQARMALAVATHRAERGAHYDPAFDADLKYRQSIDLALRSAVARSEFSLVFQPQVDMETRLTIGVEALLRWTSPEHGAVSPAVFVPLAEENGTIVEIGAWVAHEACRLAVANNWPGRLSVNVSPLQFTQDDVVAMIASALLQSGFPPNRLDIEVTESLLAQGGAIVETLEKLRDLGASIAIDDFGTGYSSLNYLSSLPLDKLKIDQSFVRQLANPRNASIVETIVSLGRRLGLVVVVEGVETEAQFDLLAALGCHIAQGYLFGRPGALPAVEQPLNQQLAPPLETPVLLDGTRG
ncbi:putative bifunctional diguanylate cyclase/phosphodiesterase [Devosia soli]|uniref:putative bifunctional diguanylate cyclase/phosphodiesterase n=1 Tax=Devosia soli TaxID=361041 RepID=UPI00137938CE|nr:EAL domain-containing protein [Devosia soli]